MRREKATTRSSLTVMRRAAQAATGDGHGQRDQARPESLMHQPKETIAGTALHQAAKSKLHHQGLKDQQQHKQPEQLGENTWSQCEAPVRLVRNLSQMPERGGSQPYSQLRATGGRKLQMAGVDYSPLGSSNR